MPDAQITIAGGGIGGLCAALSLARRGFRVTVLERAPALEAAGAGIQLSPNASRILLDLGLGSALAAAMSEPEAILVRRSDGREIVAMPLAGARERWGGPYGVIHRADLQQALHAACLATGRVGVELGSTVTGFRETGEGVLVSVDRLGDASIVEGKALIGADGVWSTLRPRIAAGHEPRFAGLRAWRALLDMRDLPPLLRMSVTTLWLGASAHVVHYPIRAGSCLNVVVVTPDADAGAGWSQPRETGALMARLAGWSPDLRTALSREPGWRTWPLFEAMPATPMSAGRVALLGDAAHAVLPFLAQGGALTIEDGAVLAAWLGEGKGSASERLACYAASRSGRIERIRRGSRANGARFHWGFPAAQLRNLALRALGGDALLSRNDWIYRWTPAFEAPESGPSEAFPRTP